MAKRKGPIKVEQQVKQRYTQEQVDEFVKGSSFQLVKAEFRVALAVLMILTQVGMAVAVFGLVSTLLGLAGLVVLASVGWPLRRWMRKKELFKFIKSPESGIEVMEARHG